jgi:DNA-binding GntR family transcriptional regulator
MGPARQALARLVEQGALDAWLGKSLRVPVMTVARWHEIGAMRIALETLAIRLAAERIHADEVARLRTLAAELATARRAGDHEADCAPITRFQLGAYSGAHAPILQRAIGDLWLMTEQYLQLLYPGYVAMVPPGWRERLCDALAQRDSGGCAAT